MTGVGSTSEIQNTATVILASQSPSRRALIEGAGLTVEVRPTGVDEDAIKQELLASNTPFDDIALALARAKGEIGSADATDAYVIAADQILVCGNQLFDKPKTLAEARTHLLFMRGRTHQLVNATVIFHGGAMVWSHIDRATLTMRPFSDSFLESYLNRCGDTVLTSVGAYRLEDAGVQLFEQIDGGYFTILGLPLVPVLAALRALGALQK